MIEILDTTSNMKIENYISQNIDTYPAFYNKIDLFEL